MDDRVQPARRENRRLFTTVEGCVLASNGPEFQSMPLACGDLPPGRELWPRVHRNRLSIPIAPCTRNIGNPISAFGLIGAWHTSRAHTVRVFTRKSATRTLRKCRRPAIGQAN